MSSGSSSSNNVSQGFSLAGTGPEKWLEVTKGGSGLDGDDGDDEKRAANLDKKKNSLFEPPIYHAWYKCSSEHSSKARSRSPWCKSQRGPG